MVPDFQDLAREESLNSVSILQISSFKALEIPSTTPSFLSAAGWESEKEKEKEKEREKRK